MREKGKVCKNMSFVDNETSGTTTAATAISRNQQFCLPRIWWR